MVLWDSITRILQNEIKMTQQNTGLRMVITSCMVTVLARPERRFP